MTEKNGRDTPSPRRTRRGRAASNNASRPQQRSNNQNRQQPQQPRARSPTSTLHRYFSPNTSYDTAVTSQQNGQQQRRRSPTSVIRPASSNSIASHFANASQRQQEQERRQNQNRRTTNRQQQQPPSPLVYHAPASQKNSPGSSGRRWNRQPPSNPWNKPISAYKKRLLAMAPNNRNAFRAKQAEYQRERRKRLKLGDAPKPSTQLAAGNSPKPSKQLQLPAPPGPPGGPPGNDGPNDNRTEHDESAVRDEVEMRLAAVQNIENTAAGRRLSETMLNSITSARDAMLCVVRRVRLGNAPRRALDLLVNNAGTLINLAQIAVLVAIHSRMRRMPPPFVDPVVAGIVSDIAHNPPPLDPAVEAIVMALPPDEVMAAAESSLLRLGRSALATLRNIDTTRRCL